MSVRGIAREAAVILDNAGFPSELKTLTLTDALPAADTETLPLPVIDNSSQLCHRITAVILSNVQHPATPEWMSTRLQQVELNVKDVIIDITNYLSHDLGHPCHAFDYEKIMALGGEIHVREAEAGMPFTTLDGASYETVGGEVVFTNADGTIIDIPGIMGTANTAVNDTTQNVLFWIESIPHEKIRFTSMTHALRTPAAQLNERALDHNLAREVMLRGIELFTELTGATQASTVYDEVIVPSNNKTLPFAPSEVERYLGIELPASEITTILTQLGCQVTESSAQELLITIPSFRTDLSMSADIVEEVARIYGYHNLPSRLMDTAIPTHKPVGDNFTLETKLKHVLAALGYQELYTYSMVGTELLERWNLDPAEHQQIRNPLTSDMEYMRQYVLPSHAEETVHFLEHSAARGTFELANIYLPQEGTLPDEHLVLTVLDTDFRQLRATLDFLANELYINDFSVEKPNDDTKKDRNTGRIFSSYGIITHKDRVLGSIGYLPEGKVGFELHWRSLLEVSQRWPEYHPVPKTAPYYEDWTLVLPNATPVGEIITALKSLDATVSTVELRDQFENNWTFRLTFWDTNEQFSSERAQVFKEKAVKSLQTLGVTLQ
ncbi:phenylalanine--tRNA ligase subunit beta [Candidatus Woesebacteria bacterium]|nr:phenylalanine--tRNA ligase subunit beta [Candidatus Woesebacteria bacterium]